MRQSNDGMLGAMPVPRLVVTMSLPIMLSMLISAVYNLVDSVYVAQYSDEAFLALSYAYPIQMLLVAFCSGIGVGFSAIFSRVWTVLLGIRSSSAVSRKVQSKK